MKFLFYIIIVVLSISCETVDEVNVKNKKVSFSKDTSAAEESASYTSEVYFIEDKGWGYRILSKGKPFINQPHIPSVSGNNGFSSEAKAQITADFIVEKLNNGIMPPSITKSELDSLKVLD